MKKAPTRKRRVLRLSIAGLLGAVFLLYAIGALVATTAPRGRLPDLSTVSSKSRADAHLAHAVSVVAGRGAEVRCWSHADWKKRTADYERRWPNQRRLGPWRAYTSYQPVPAVDFSPEICIELTKLAHLGVPVWSDTSPDALAWSVAALAHESMHVSGYQNEAVAECWGMQSIPRAAVALGRTPKEGEYLAKRYWNRWYRWHRPPYRSRECRDGRALDLRPETDVWP